MIANRDARILVVNAHVALRDGGAGIEESPASAMLEDAETDQFLRLLRQNAKSVPLLLHNHEALEERLSESSELRTLRIRALLRAAFVEQLTPARIGAMYGVHRTTAMRWLEGAQEEILNHTRTTLIERHQLTPSECNRLFSLVKTGIDASLASLLASAP